MEFPPFTFRNPQTGQTHPIPERGLRIGRAAGNDLVLADEEASRYHATVWVHGGQAYIRDENSTNGTWVNERRITAPTPLRPGDRIRLGKTVLEVVGREPGATVVSMPEAVPVPPSAPFPPAAPPFPPAAPPFPPAVPPVSPAARPGRQARSPLLWILVGIGALLLCGALVGGGLLVRRQGLAAIPFLASPTPIPGIDKPIRIDGTEVTFVRAEKRDWFSSIFGVYRPASAQDTLLVVDAEIPPEQYDWDTVSDWSILLNDNIEPSITQGSDSGEVTWVFVVRKSATTFILTLPDGTKLDLKPILR